MNESRMRYCSLIEALLCIVFFICTFNALIQGFLSRTVITILYVGLLLICSALLVFQHRFFLFIRGTKGTISACITIFIVWEVIAYTTQVVRNNITQLSLQNFLQTIIPIFMFFLASNLNDIIGLYVEKVFVFLAAASVVMGIFNSIIPIFPQTWFGDELVGIADLYFHRGYSMAGMSLGTGWICGIAIGFLLHCRKEGHITSRLVIVIFFVLTMGNLLTFSRGGVFFEAIIIAVYLLLFRTRFVSRNRTLLFMMLFCLVIFAIIFNWNHIVSSTLFQRYVINGFSRTEGSNVLRGNYQSIARQNIREHPLFGIGFGYVGSNAWNMHIPDAYPTENYFYLLALDSGLPGAILFLVASIISIVHAIGTDRSFRYYVPIVIGTLIWGTMMTVLEGDLCSLIYWYCIGRTIAKNNH